jgi:formylglycine-generating enzyme required for sulfatase activity
MVRIDAPAGSFCIDRYEATNADFNAYLGDPGAVFQAPPMCNSVAGSWPGPVTGMDTLPAAGMAQCHAWSYCLWAGKRLCSSIGPDAGHATVGSDLSNEWMYACQNGTHAFEFGYGAMYVAGDCNVPDPEAGIEGGVAVTPGGFAACHGVLDGGFTAIFDLSGNVSEYDDYASDYDANASTRSRGGSWQFANGACSQAIGFASTGGFGDVGFRCCADVAP